MKIKKNSFLAFFIIFSFFLFNLNLNNIKAGEKRGNPSMEGAASNSMRSNPVVVEDILVEDKIEVEIEEGEDNEQESSLNKKNVKTKGLENAIQRRSQVANAVQEMLKVAERSGGIGDQVRVMAQNQEKTQEKIEASLEKIQNRNKLMRFVFGPDSEEIKNARRILQENQDELTQLENVRSQLTNIVDQEKVQEQIEKIQEARAEIEQDLNKSEKVFSLFGWMRNIFSK
ncbi:MAG: hypothetical protein WC164_03785 [Patescibacteria group bacterium]|nr:hypothetical protein [Patescibacteria group bacterium]